MKKNIILFLSLFLSTHLVFGQFFSSPEDPDYYLNRINDLGEFMDRFSRRQIPNMFDSSDANLPYLQVVSCFCFDSVRERKHEVEAFAREMVDSNITLGLHDSNYCCELTCGATYNNQNALIKLQLVMEQTADSGYCWAIANVRGEVLQMVPNRIASSMHISPADNDMHFVELFDVLESSSENILNYTCSNWSIDETSSFVALLAADKLKVKEIKDICYVFYVGGYEFRVRKINRETNNNGWLITEFKRNTNS